jgi:hypothetical protein
MNAAPRLVVPALQAVQIAALSTEVVPAAHAAQVDRPVLAAIRPAVQLLHEVIADCWANMPNVQSLQ